MREMKAAATPRATVETVAHPITISQPAATVAPGKEPIRAPTAYTGMNGRPGRNLRAEHRQVQQQRVDESARLAEKYPRLKSLTLSLEFVDKEGITKTTAMKYSTNPEHAKSVLLFACPNRECIGGDFDLTAKLAGAVAARQTKVAGEMYCLGSHNQRGGKVTPCRNLLRFTLSLAYLKGRAPRASAGGR
jgi:hypothetical protein